MTQYISTSKNIENNPNLILLRHLKHVSFLTTIRFVDSECMYIEMCRFFQSVEKLVGRSFSNKDQDRALKG